MLPESAKLISVDDHIIEHPDVWTARLANKFQDQGPRVVEIPGGRQAWYFEEDIFPQVGLNAVAGKDPSEFNTDPVRFDEMREGCYNPNARLKDMDADGVHAQLCFPSFPRFCGQRFLEARDKDLALACVRAYNDFIIDEWCGSDPQRFIPMTIIPLWDVSLAVAEVHRTVVRGSRAVAFTENPTPLGLPSFHTDHWYPLLAAVEEADIPLCMHIGSSSKMIESSADAPYPVHIVLNGLNSIVAAGDLLCSQVFTQFPRLRIALSEGGAGWVPYILERARQTWQRHGQYGGLDLSTDPEETFRNHFGVCFIEDHFAIANRDQIGAGVLMWESDYPHADTSWPNSRTLVSTMLSSVPDHEAAAIAEGNARKFFRFYD